MGYDLHGKRSEWVTIMRVTDYLDDTASSFPDKIAFVDGRRAITFNELREEALSVADVLARRGLFKQPIAVFMEKCVECIVSFLGVAYSGNFYTPIDTEMPSSRIEKIMETLQPQLIITNRQSQDQIAGWSGDIPVLIYEEITQKPCDVAFVLEATKKVLDSDVLYVLFTSGSTGVPKGVVVPHRAVRNYIDWFVETFQMDEETVLGNQAPLFFDLSIQDVYGTLKSGCTTYLLDKSLFSFPAQLMGFLGEHAINMIMWAPSALCLVANLKGLKVKTLPSLKHVLFCGEVMPNKQLNQWRAAYPETTFVNLYGPTEACDAIAYYAVDRPFADDEALPIGRAIRNVEVLVIKENNMPVEASEQGELCIRGASLAHGYYNNPEKTQEAFVQNPLCLQYPEIIYRTGDLVHYNERGELVYNGRKDFQIKHMGHRIELGEIEMAVSSLDGIKQNCCLYDGEKGKIVLFYAGDLDGQEMTVRLKELIPEYMLPHKKVKMDKLPLNMNGKIDRVKLKEML